MDHLAALPLVLHTVSSGAAERCLLTGDIDGATAGLGTALAEHGWELHPPDVLVTADPLPALSRTDLLAVVTTVPVAVNHARLVRPLLAGGAVAQVLLVDERQQIVSQHLLPIDQTLPVDPTIVARFREPRTLTIDQTTEPSTTCAACHAAAFATWAYSGHAAAFQWLPEASRTDGCIICHTTALTAAPSPRTAGVTCTACHQEAAAHAAAPTTHTTGIIDCRACHDGQHHPAFDRETAWKAVAH